MGRGFQRVMSLAITVIVAFGMLVFGTGEASAYGVTSSVRGSATPVMDQIYVGEEGQIVLEDATDVMNINSVTLSDPSMAKVRKEYGWKHRGGKHYLYYLKGKKPGEVTLSINYKVKGKIKTINNTVTIVDYPNPIKSIKINGKKVSLKGSKRYQYISKCSKRKTSITIKVVPEKGWKIIKASGEKFKKRDVFEPVNISKLKSKIKKGKAISFTKKYKALDANVLLEGPDKTKFYYYFNFDR